MRGQDGGDEVQGSAAGAVVAQQAHNFARANTDRDAMRWVMRRGFEPIPHDEGMLVADGSEHLLFSDDYAFSSPSAAAAVVCGRQANGRTAWVVEGSGQTYAAWQDQQLSAVSIDPTESTQGSF